MITSAQFSRSVHDVDFVAILIHILGALDMVGALALAWALPDCCALRLHGGTQGETGDDDFLLHFGSAFLSTKRAPGLPVRQETKRSFS